MRLDRHFYERPGLEVARDLLGRTVVRVTDSGERLEGRVVETEAYLGQDDPCCHSYQRKPTARTQAMFMTPGTAYVYNVYYNYCCFNISCKGDGAVVLIRAIEPITGQGTMQIQRRKNIKKQKTIPHHLLANGPSKLCMALEITKSDCNEVDLVTDDKLWLETGQSVIGTEKIISTSRVGLGKQLSEEYRDKPWRFYIQTSPSISIRDKMAENTVVDVDSVRVESLHQTR